MPKPLNGDWRKHPATDAQIRRLLYLLSKNGELEVSWRGGGADYDEHEATEWVRQAIGIHLHTLSSLTKEQIQLCFEELE